MVVDAVHSVDIVEDTMEEDVDSVVDSTEEEDIVEDTSEVDVEVDSSTSAKNRLINWPKILNTFADVHCLNVYFLCLK